MIARLADAPTLETRRLTLRAPRLEDFETWARFAASDRARHLGGPHDYGTAWRSFAHVAGQWAMRGYGSFVFHRKGSEAPLGMTGPWHPIHWPEQELGWTIWDETTEGAGLAFEAASCARDHAFRDLGWPTAVSYIADDNPRSIALAERLGATRDKTAAHPHPERTDILVYRHAPPKVLQ